MKASLVIMAAAGALILTGCANHEGVAPSQNTSLQSVSPTTTEESEKGYMQRSLDAWLKEEWTPLTTPHQSTGASSGTAENAQPVGSATVAAIPEPKDNAPFTLQKYADKWKVYLENKEKMNAGKPKDTSHAEMLNRMPLIGK